MQLAQILSQVKTKFQISLNFDQASKINISNIAIDSRLVKENTIFFALKGKEKNGIEFVESAFANGASVVVASEEIKVPANKILIKIS